MQSICLVLEEEIRRAVEKGCRTVAYSKIREEELREQGCREVAWSKKREEELRK